MDVILPLLELAKMDIMQEVKQFTPPAKLQRIAPLPFASISFKNLAWFWSITDPKEMIIAICEVFYYPNLNRLQKLFNPKSEKWASKWLPDCPVIDFYRFVGVVTNAVSDAAEDFSRMQVELTPEEKQAGYGAKDPESIQKMIYQFAQRMGINDLEKAAEYPWVVYRFVFKTEIENANKQRAYNKILNKPKK
jgi:hypothetical protein